MEQLYITKLKGYNFKNLITCDIQLNPGINILCGPNAVGKTNTVEALQLLTSGSSFKHSTVDQLITTGANQGSVEMDVVGVNRFHTVRLELKDGKKTFYKNNKKTTTSELKTLLPSVLFYPDDLYVVKGSSKHRRYLIDVLGSQTHQQYHLVKTDYEKVLQQRNNLLKQRDVDRALLDVWTKNLITYGSRLTVYRIKLIQHMMWYFIDHYQKLAPQERIDIAYRSSTGVVVTSCAEKDIRESTLTDQLCDRFESSILAMQDKEIYYQRSLVGPHLDDIQFTINTFDARTYGSQGQQRSVILAWKMAEVDLLKEYRTIYPIVLLDDVMSELDSTRRKHILACIDSKAQAVITTTHLEYFADCKKENMKVIPIG